MTDLDDMDKVLVDLLEIVTGLPRDRIISAEQTHPAPKDLFITYNLIPIGAYGFPRRERKLVDATEPTTLPNWQDIEEKLFTQLEMTLSINAYNTGAANLMWKLQNADMLYPVTVFLHSNRIAWRYCSNARNLTAISQARYQERYQTDVNLFIEGEMSVDILAANSAEIIYKDENGNTLQEGIINVV